jgi:aminopeptidase
MPDPRVTAFAKVLIHYSLGLQPGQQLSIYTSPLADELAVAAYTQAIQAGAHVFVQNALPEAEEIFYKHATDAQLDYISPVRRLLTETFDAELHLEADHNTRALSGVNPARIARSRKARAPLRKIFDERAARGDLRWCLTLFPTQALAQEADMSLADYREFVYAACLLNEPDPVAAWQREGERQRQWANWLAGKDRVTLKGANIDLRLSIKDRRFIVCDGKMNFPDGEIFTGPVEDTANGWVRFRYPAIEAGQEVTDIELWFENGRVVKETATKNQALLTSLLNTDAGARYLGEWGIGVNYGIQRFTKNMLFDEKLGGTIHLAVGASYAESGGKNDSGLHWDMLCDMAESEITVDDEVFYRNGQIVV